MSTKSKSKVVNLFTLLVVLLTAFQGVIPTMPVQSPGIIALISGLTMFLVSGFTVWKQYISIEINNKAVTPTLIVALVATIGAMNELFNVLHFGEVASQWIRFGITASTMALNLVSKVLWPTPETKSNL